MKILFITLTIFILSACKTTQVNEEKEQPYKSVETGEAAIPLSTIPANYPLQAVRKELEGHVKFVFDILTDGKPVNIRVVESIPEGVFDKDALRALKLWRFKPKYIKGEPVIQKSMRYTMEFRIDNKSY